MSTVPQRSTRAGRGLGGALLVLALAPPLVACETEHGQLALQLVGSPDPLDAPLEGVAQRLRIVVSGRQGRSGPLTVAVSAGAARLPAIPTGGGQVITVEGLGPAGNVVSRGRSAPLTIRGGEAALALYLGRVERFSLIAATPSGKRRGMIEARAFHAAAALDDGSVLLIGGTSSAWRPEQTLPPSATATVERVDGNALRFGDESPCDRPRGCLQRARLGHTATRLALDDTVLVIGGTGSSGPPVPSAEASELYSSGASAFFEGPPLAASRSEHAAVALGADRVVLGGGRSADALSAGVEVYQRGGLAPLPRLQQARRNFTLSALADGTVVAVGGFDERDRPLASSELLLPGAPQWRAGPALQVARAHHTATLLADGAVLLVGGLSADGIATAAVERLDPQSARIVAELTTPRWAHSTSRLHDGRLLVVGGFAVSVNGSPSNSFEELQIGSSGSFNARPRCCLRLPRAGHSATVLPSGWLLIAGGITESALPTAGTATALPQVTDTAEVFIY